MTRLIDADELNTYDVSPAYGMTVIGLTEEDIELAPTIDAIPVEWIKRWSKEPMTKKDMKLAEQCEWNILEWLIADWQRKEE